MTSVPISTSAKNTTEPSPTSQKGPASRATSYVTCYLHHTSLTQLYPPSSTRPNPTDRLRSSSHVERIACLPLSPL
ncbi:hypothetical protein K505DRAFT_321696 [Melanomma pulvis-pyrius CBS 109.77]|uniref:Uncharacterized protein n=1 Tax=Melanomma pulvis-pyrius CBS 109.77 TaxID=1314802 RepID=A0A6A6XQK4_9PLEO|nr:hypothetical protein K505DRAFT_321696 [Melanomma pulvis-pyrius CBS 109.77]